MPVLDEDSYVRQATIITFLWLVAMFVGGVLLITFNDVFTSMF